MSSESEQVQKLIVASPEDLSTVEEALTYVWRSELDFIFEARAVLEDTLVLVFDSSTLYVWRREKGTYRRYSFQLTCSAKDFSHDWWACGPVIRGLETCLPLEWGHTDRKLSFVSGSFITPTIEGQKRRERPLNPYTTRESYLATVVHEFGHVYFDKLTQVPNNDQYSQKLVETALAIYQGRPAFSDLVFPSFNKRFWSEIFAFCTDRAASNIFWPGHKAAVDRANVALLEKVLSGDGESNKYWDLPPLEKTHMSAAIVGPILIETLGNSWPEHILGLEYKYKFEADGGP
jgi:hypothetical protein